MPSRQRNQKVIRNGHAKVITEVLAKKLNKRKELERISTTGKLLPLGSLRRRCVKRLFSGWVLQFVGLGRIIALKLATEVVRRLRKKYGMPKGDEAERKRMHHLLKLARKRQIGKVPLGKVASKAAMSSMDNMETLQMEYADDVAPRVEPHVEVWQDCMV